MTKNIVWKISIITKYGADIVLVNQQKKPTQTQLNKLEKKWKKEFDMSMYGTDARIKPTDRIAVGSER